MRRSAPARRRARASQATTQSTPPWPTRGSPIRKCSIFAIRCCSRTSTFVPAPAAEEGGTRATASSAQYDSSSAWTAPSSPAIAACARSGSKAAKPVRSERIPCGARMAASRNCKAATPPHCRRTKRSSSGRRPPAVTVPLERRHHHEAFRARAIVRQLFRGGGGGRSGSCGSSLHQLAPALVQHARSLEFGARGLDLRPPGRNLAATLRDDRLGTFDRRLLVRRLIRHHTTTPVRRLPVAAG